MARNILIVDDEVSIQDSLRGVLTDEGYKVSTVSSGKAALEFLSKDRPDLVLLDIWMPEMDGIETLKQIKSTYPDQTVIMMSGHGTIETAVKSTKLGAYDFVEKPLSLEHLLVLLQNAAEAHDLMRVNHALRKQVQKSRSLVGNSPGMNQIRDIIKQVGPTTGSVLITGENGTGKELVANGVHAHSPRFKKAFVEVNCAAIPEELIESELFGHEKGAFTGATQLRRGKFDLANGGTLFLDEIGDMSLKTQAKILRILQEQKFERVGGSQTISVDVRVVAATNKDLKQAIQGNKFREDLYYRLNVIPCHVPPLRSRVQDIPMLAEHFLNEFCATHGKKLRKLSPGALKAMGEYAWPGNVRELKNLIERIIILTKESEDGKVVEAADLFDHLEQEASGMGGAGAKADGASLASTTTHTNLRDARVEFEKEFIQKTLKEHGGNISKAAAVLGIERSHLHRKIKAFGIEV
jgi:two-component system, NtrC family, nitrogen regulation response regulator NtrX